MSTNLTVALFPAGDLFEDFYDKIGVSLDQFREEQTGGWLFNLIEALQAQGIQTVLFFVSARVSAAVRFTHAGTGTEVCVLPAPSLHRRVRSAHHRYRPESKLLSSVASYLATPIRPLVREVRRAECGLLLCQEYEHARFDVCVALGRLLGMPVFATYQGGNRPASALEVPFRKASVRACTGLIVGAQTEIERLRTSYRIAPDKLGHIPNTMDVARWHPGNRASARAELRLAGALRVVVWHGRVQIHRKGLDVLLDAWGRICDERKPDDLRLLLVGSGRNGAELRRLIHSSSVDNVMWIDRYVQDRAELWRYLSAADVYTLPSRHEGFPVAPIEAMACGLPVVAADASGVPDIFEGGEASGGLVVPRGDAAALAGALGGLLDDISRARELGERARRRAEEKFSYEAVGEQLRIFIANRAALGDER